MNACLGKMHIQHRLCGAANATRPFNRFRNFLEGRILPILTLNLEKKARPERLPSAICVSDFDKNNR
jgi:hypothetical protein